MSRTDRIDQITDAQRAALAPYAQEWIRRALDTSSADRLRVEAGIRACYRHAALAEPRVIVWVPSPIVVAFAGPIAAAILGHDAVRDAVGGAVAGAVGGAVRDAVGGAVHDAVRDAVDGAVHGAVADGVGGAVAGAVGGAVRDAVDDAVRDAVDGAVHGGQWHQYLGGQWWSSWLAYVSAIRDVCGLDLPILARHADYEAAQSAGWWWPHRDFVIVSERAGRIRTERVGPDGWISHRLHSLDGPSVAWEGWALYHVHGVRVPAHVVEDPASITLGEIDAEQNAEVRRVLIEQYGPARYVLDSGAVVVDQADDEIGQPMRLLRREVPGDEPIVLVEVHNSGVEADGSRRVFHLRVPPTCTSAFEARNWVCGIEADQRFDAQT